MTSAPTRTVRAAPAWALGLVLLLAAPCRAEDGAPAAGPDAPSAVAEASLEALDARFLVEREAAVAALIAGLPGTRAAVLDAFRGADGRREGLLARVLAADGSRESLDALLRALPRTTDPATVSAIRASLVEHADGVAAAVAAWRDEHGDVPPAIAELDRLIRRARVEEQFLARKSRSGLTGSYPGQFEVLRPERRLALDVCLAILLDRPVRVPGQFPYGSYRWLRPPTILVEKLELRYMALHAIGELARPEDTDVVEALVRLEGELSAVVNRRGRWLALTDAGLHDSVLTTLAVLQPDPWLARAEAQITLLSRNESNMDDAAAMCLRLGQYRRAVALYRSLERLDQGALVSYNLACAYARWAAETRDADEAADHRERSLDALERAHRGGYADWTWMDEDLDLQTVRGDPRYAALRKAMQDEVRLPAVPDPARGGPR